MDFMTIMQTRKSIRAYEDKPVSREDLIKIVEVGRLTPSACNSQPWKFIIVDEPEAKQNFATDLYAQMALQAVRGEIRFRHLSFWLSRRQM